MDAIGGGVLVAVAAALWIAYLLPTWLRRRQYLDTERNAVRLQQTLRILAETAETPETVRVAATAREVAAQQRILAEREETARLAAETAEQLAIAERIAAEEAAAAARARAAQAQALATQPITVVADAPAPAFEASGAAARTARRSVRRRRVLCSFVLLVSFVLAVAGVIGLASGWSPLVAAAGGVGVVAAFTALVVLARRMPAAAGAPTVVARPDVDVEAFEPVEVEAEAAEASEHGWTPQPLPKPLHLSRGTIAAAAMASVEAAEQLRRAAVEAELAERAARIAPPVPRIAPKPVDEPVASADPAASMPVEADRYAAMGVVGDTAPGFDSLDAVLRRRRQSA
ncbi:hypothetical protein ET445_08345 [Agromyces protaetiae]|uniref:Large exoprotein n=1 Tax=Agromyces protaetiae TaxID=2509455 RepID=A0A4P6FEC0_9MICO|nr:hypothetical protein [Agromyces protaetiae]QAY73353.1 hypothetical protein ET445_08345 [Agromyces protaetiae]